MLEQQDVRSSDFDQNSKKATVKARELLCEILPADALEEYLTHGYFHHNGKVGVYRISEGSQTEISCKSGLHATACLQLTVPAPTCDRMIAEYLILKNDEALYWNKANIFPAKGSRTVHLTLAMGLLNIGLLLKLGLDYLF
jgi:hypothetical protein